MISRVSFTDNKSNLGFKSGYGRFVQPSAEMKTLVQSLKEDIHPSLLPFLKDRVTIITPADAFFHTQKFGKYGIVLFKKGVKFDTDSRVSGNTLIFDGIYAPSVLVDAENVIFRNSRFGRINASRTVYLSRDSKTGYVSTAPFLVGHERKSNALFKKAQDFFEKFDHLSKKIN